MRGFMANSPAGLTLFVATDGDDAWSGGLPAPDARRSDGPLASLTAARDVIRRIRSVAGGLLQQPIEVQVRGGTYRMTEPLALTAGDSGTEDCPITYKAYPGERPVLSGGVLITGWKPYKGRIVCVELPEVRAGLWWFRQLFYNDKRMVRSRCPKLDRADPLYGGWAFVESVLPDELCPTAIRFESGVFPRRWAKPQQAEIVVVPGKCWLSDIIPIKAVDIENRVIELKRPVGPSANTLGAATHLVPGNRFFVENNLEDLSEPGEWCLDAQSGMLYLWPPDDALESAQVVAPVTARLIQMIGSPEAPLRHVRISGFTFRHTQAQWPTSESYYKTPNAGQTVYLEHTEDCAIEQSLFDAVGGDAIRLQNANARARLCGNEIAGAGAYGIFVGSFQRGFARHDARSGDLPSPIEWHEHPEDRAASAAAWPRSVGHLICDNHIHHVGYFEKHAAGIAFFGVSAIDVVVAHNLIHHTPRFGIGLMSGLGSVTIDYNDLHDLSLETCDTGGITFNRWYTYDQDPELSRGCIVRFNRVRDVIGCGAYAKKQEPGGATRAGGRISTPYYSWGIYFDNAPMNVQVYGNIVARNTLGGIMISHWARDVTVENNVFVDSERSQAYVLLAGKMSGIRMRRNIFSYANPSAAFLRLDLWAEMDLKQVFAAFDQNVLHSASGEPGVIGLPDGLPAWRKLGFDARSIVADPRFVAAADDNYDLRMDSPALKLGFVPIDVSRIGPRRWAT
jgi:hypothetical protein